MFFLDQFLSVLRVASRQRVKSSRLSGPHLTQSPIGYIAPLFVLKSPQIGTVLVAFPQQGQIKITLGILFVSMSVTVKTGGAATVEEDKTLSLGVGDGPCFES